MSTKVLHCKNCEILHEEIKIFGIYHWFLNMTEKGITAFWCKSTELLEDENDTIKEQQI